MAPGSGITFLVLSAAAASALAAVPACSNVSGLYSIGGGGNEVILWQPMGCDFMGFDMEGGNISGTVVGNNMTINVSSPGEPMQTMMGLFDPSTMSFTVFQGSDTAVLRRINCTQGFTGYWSNSVSSFAISENPMNCTGTMFHTAISLAMPIPLVISQLSATFSVDGSARTAMFRFPDTIVIGSEPPYKKSGTYPCFRVTDFKLNPQCFLDLVALQQTGAFTALNSSLAKKNITFSTVHATGCVSGNGATAQTCKTPCSWRSDGGQGWCNCPDEASCLAAGFGWISRPYPCDSGLSAQMASTTSDCCSGGPDFCQVIGTPPQWGNPSPSPYPYPGQGAGGAGCIKVPMAAVQNLEAATNMVVRRCGGAMPSPSYMPSPSMGPPPSPYYMPSPSYMGPSPSYMGPPMGPSPSYMPPPSPSFMR